VVEFDARVEEVPGTMAAILMWPLSDQWPPEIDILETPGLDVMHTLHWDADSGPRSVDAYDAIRNQAFDPTGWHHYRMTWLPDSLRIEVDAKQVAAWSAHIPDEPMGFGAMGFVGSVNDTWMGGAPNASPGTVVTAHLDNVLMSQWDGIGG
jgi:beta-glucanase (GH16 family)